MKKTDYKLFVSLFLWALFRAGIFAEDMNFIIDMFGFGMIVHMVGSIIMYRWEQKRSRL